MRYQAGMDVARKAVILARQCGLGTELSDVALESLVPEPLRDAASTDEFLQRLPEARAYAHPETLKPQNSTLESLVPLPLRGAASTDEAPAAAF